MRWVAYFELRCLSIRNQRFYLKPGSLTFLTKNCVQMTTGCFLGLFLLTGVSCPCVAAWWFDCLRSPNISLRERRRLSCTSNRPLPALKSMKHVSLFLVMFYLKQVGGSDVQDAAIPGTPNLMFCASDLFLTASMRVASTIDHSPSPWKNLWPATKLFTPFKG